MYPVLEKHSFIKMGLTLPSNFSFTNRDKLSFLTNKLKLHALIEQSSKLTRFCTSLSINVVHMQFHVIVKKLANKSAKVHHSTDDIIFFATHG